MRRGILALLLTAAAGVAPGQSPEEKPSHPPHAIQDNSFLVWEPITKKTASSRGQYSILLYFSFEHPFRRAKPD